MNLKGLLIIAGTVAFLVIGKLVMTATQKSTVIAAPDPTKPEIARRLVDRSDPEANPARTEAPDLKIESLRRSKGCESDAPAIDSVHLDVAEIRQLIAGKNAYRFFVEDKSCIVQNKIYPVDETRFDPQTGTIFYQNKIGTVRVVEIQRIPLQLLNEALAGEITRVQMQQILDRVQQRLGAINRRNRVLATREIVTAIKLKLEELSLAQAEFGAPLKHPAAKTISAKRGETSLDGYTIWDVRPKRHFASGAIPQAVNVEVVDYMRMRTLIMSPSHIEQIGSGIAEDKYPKNKETSIIVYGNGPYDFSAYNVLSLLANRGYQRLFWLRGGIDEWQGTPNAIEYPPYVTLIDAPQAATLLHQGATIVDLRAGPQFNVSRPVMAVNLPIRIQLDDRDQLKYFKGVPTAEQLRAAQEDFALQPNFPKDAKLILYGRTTYDGRAVRAAVLLNSLGYRNIYVLRGGFFEWMHYARFEPAKYPTIGLNGGRGVGQSNIGDRPGRRGN